MPDKMEYSTQSRQRSETMADDSIFQAPQKKVWEF
jgi:hypothetical protein